jgi:hypothetical protein
MSRRAWPLALAAREGVETARAGRWTSALIISAVTWLVAAPAAADALDTAQLVAGERDWIADGAYVFVVTGFKTQDSQNPVPAGACDRLGQVDGIQASFAASHSPATFAFASSPGARLTVVDVTPGVTAYLGTSVDTHGVALATEGLARRSGVAEGEPVVVRRRAGPGVAAATSDVLRVRIVSSRQLGDEYDGVLLVPTLVRDRAEACFVRTDAAHVRAVENLLPAALAWDGKPALPQPLLFQGKHTVDYTHAFEDRPLRWVWVATGALLGLLWAMIQWFRRSQVAIYTTFGMRAAPRLVMQVAEWGVLAAIGGAWGWALGVAGAIARGARAEQALAQVSWHALLTLLVASLTVVLLGLRPTGTLLNELKDR